MEIKASGENQSGDTSKRRVVFERFSKPKPSKDIEFDYKDIDNLYRYVTEHGKIVPRRVTRITAQQQRDLTIAVKRARILSLMSYTGRN